MQVPVIKKLVEIHAVEDLEEAEAAILDEQEPTIEIEGEDDGEQLTHVMAAIWIIEKMEKDQIPFGKAMRDYTAKVRESIN
tara:strand:- start:241 stop:483 length:243 start_codon:yes stop_codon:yes gene_type:complete